MALIGNTIMLEAKFKRPFLNTTELVDPEEIVFSVYELGSKKILIYESFLGQENKVSQGIYRVFYTIPEGGGNLLLEVKSTIDGKSVVGTKLESRELFKR